MTSSSVEKFGMFRGLLSLQSGPCNLFQIFDMLNAEAYSPLPILMLPVPSVVLGVMVNGRLVVLDRGMVMDGVRMDRVMDGIRVEMVMDDVMVRMVVFMTQVRVDVVIDGVRVDRTVEDELFPSRSRTLLKMKAVSQMGQINNKTAVIKKTKKDLLPFKGRIKLKGGNDVPQPMDQYMEPAQYGDKDVLNNSTEVHPSDRTRQTDRAVYRINPRTSGKEHWLEPRPDDRTYRTRARLSRPSKDHSRARLSLGREEPEDGHTFPPGRPSRQSRTCPYLYPVHASGSMNLDSSRRVILDQSALKTESLTH
ncbi:hypothetical protein DY000_02060147 [Brassica cretica]|uniref:Uncharacterized protein n=1 Tax=Brassica cretica TaxID=69181 RepID=A0ABQ7AUN3_BRACR|nr:hypothetical protein DY000_02060147 [Brassica cretica]